MRAPQPRSARHAANFPKELLSSKPSKYRAVRTKLDGETFDSKGEAARWAELKQEEKFRLITDLRRQVRYPLVVNGVEVGVYVADFVYNEFDGPRVVRPGGLAGPELETKLLRVVEDFKGHRLPVYQLKKKLMKALYGIDIRETGAPARSPRTKRRA